MCKSKPTLVLVGEDGNAFFILGKAQKVAKGAGWSEEKRKQFIDEAMSGDYDHLLRVCMEYFEVMQKRLHRASGVFKPTDYTSSLEIVVHTMGGQAKAGIKLVISAWNQQI